MAKLGGRNSAGLVIPEPRSSAIDFSACLGTLVFGTNRNLIDFSFFTFRPPFFGGSCTSPNSSKKYPEPFHQLRNSWLKASLIGLGSFLAPLDVVNRCSRWRPRPLPFLLRR